MKSLKFLAFVFIVGMTAACSGKPEGTDAEVTDAQEVAEVSSEATSFAINTDNSTISWIGSKPAGKHNGWLPITEGSIAVRDGQIEGGKIVMSVTDIQNEDLAGDPDSQAKLVGHLKSADFFDAENHPTATFEITSVEPFDGSQEIVEKEEFETEFTPATNKENMVEEPTHTITGNLTMRGKTLAVSFPANVSMENGQISAKAKFNIDRTNWGLMYGDEASALDKAKDKFIYNTVNIGFEVTAAASNEMASM
ncbi:YceI family protein [Fulvivirga sedimenti]|jgi:polyisoprenoid-binding protein YceI|uniref:YceI family protein n=1 Tax=Fulvivirga sedimenti TaxID=2879465 RepID=A0A9X1HJN2_9BACT|nr:YceI family protein [Fulvivirga sedimenti]MCA6073348.1 YceI family protein [Fulvivirga sedimenti]